MCRTETYSGDPADPFGSSDDRLSQFADPDDGDVCPAAGARPRRLRRQVDRDIPSTRDCGLTHAGEVSRQKRRNMKKPICRDCKGADAAIFL